MTLALRELHSIRSDLTVLRNALAADRLDMIAPSVKRIESSIERLETLEKFRQPFSPLHTQ